MTEPQEKSRQLVRDLRRFASVAWQKSRSFLGCCWTGSCRLSSATLRLCRQRLLPGVYRGGGLVKAEMVKINRSQNWRRHSSSTLIGNAAGLGVAVLSTRIVESLVETRELSNLWGLFASRPVVSEGTFEVFTFVVEYLLAIIVFAVTDHYVSEYRRSKEEAGGMVSADNDS